MTFYINEAHIAESDWDHECIGLFDKENWTGEGNFCGWYGAEYYRDTTLIAYGIQLGHTSIYNPKRPFDGGFKIVKEHYDKYIAEGLDDKDALKRVAKDRNVDKREIYRELKIK